VKVRGSIFGSKSEARAFKTLLSRWSPNLSLYPSLPLANLLEVEAGELKPKERDFYLKTSVDYTFCELDGRPILSMEFDGLGGGFSRGTEYLQERETPDPYRKLKLDFKLRMANQVGYPLIVISSDEMEPVDNDERLTILDGIVGAFLSSQDTPRRLDEMLREKRSELEGLHPEVAHSLLQDLVLHAETDAEFANDLFVKEGAHYMARCFRGGIHSFEVKWLEDPPFTLSCDGWDPKWLSARIKHLKHVKRVGCRVAVNAQIVRTVWMRNIKAPGISPNSITRNIAEYLAFKRASSVLLDRA
jgi:hypothetical protein